MQIIRFASAVIMIGAPFLAFAQVNQPPGGGGAPPGGISIALPNPLSCTPSPGAGQTQVECILNKIIDALLLFAGPIVVIMILVGAFQILTSAGNPEKVTTGRKTIIYAAVGYGIIILAKGVVLVIQNFISS